MRFFILFSIIYITSINAFSQSLCLSIFNKSKIPEPFSKTIYQKNPIHRDMQKNRLEGFYMGDSKYISFEGKDGIRYNAKILLVDFVGRITKIAVATAPRVIHVLEKSFGIELKNTHKAPKAFKRFIEEEFYLGLPKNEDIHGVMATLVEGFYPGIEKYITYTGADGNRHAAKILTVDWAGRIERIATTEGINGLQIKKLRPGVDKLVRKRTSVMSAKNYIDAILKNNNDL